MNITVSSILMMILMGLSVVLLIVSAIFLDGVVKTRPKERYTVTSSPLLMGSKVVSVDLEMQIYKRNNPNQGILNQIKAADINIASCTLAILVAIVQTIFSALFLFKILPKLFWGIAEVICLALLVIVFALALAYGLWILGFPGDNRDPDGPKLWSTGRHEAFVAFVGMNILFLAPTLVYVMFADKSK